MKTVSQLKDGVAGLLSGADLNDVTNLDNAIERAARTLSQKIYIPEQMNPFAFTLYANVINYAGPVDIFGNMFVDIQPIGISRTILDYVYRQPVEVFDRTKLYSTNGYQITFEYNKGTPTMRIAQTKANQSVLLDPMNSTTGWTAAGTASGLIADNTVFYLSPASLRFNLTGAGVGTLTETLTSPNDLTSYKGVGVAFLALDTPSASNLTSIELRIGSSATNYYSVIATTAFLGAWPANDFALVSFDLSTATTVGTPIITAMNYQQLLFTTAATINNMRVGQLFISLPSPHKLLYQTDAIFLDTTLNTLSQVITDDNNQIILNDSAYNIFEYECALTIGLQNGGTIASGRINEINSLLNGTRTRTGVVVTLGLYDLYRQANPSEEVKTVGNWYED